MARSLVNVVCSSIVVLVTGAIIAGTGYLLIKNQGYPPPRYYAVITSADLDLGRPDGTTTRTSFDLSLGVAASPGRVLTGVGYCLCLERGTVVQVSYRGVPLARAVFESWEAVCAPRWMPPRKAWWTRVVASANNIIATLPGFVVDGLAADERRGERVLDVSIWMTDGRTTAWCGARRVGDADKKAAAACDLRNSTNA